MLSSFDAQLHMPTVDDMLLPKLVKIGAALALPDADTADTTSPLRQWQQCVTEALPRRAPRPGRARALPRHA